MLSIMQMESLETRAIHEAFVNHENKPFKGQDISFVEDNYS